MNDKNTQMTVWEPNPPVEIASDATAREIAARARALTARDIHSIATAFDAGSFEMVSTFVWARAITGLKKQIASLGMEFVGQMLGRPDITENSDPKTAISELDGITLAEDLGMITTTEALRLKHSLELVAHFSDPENAAQEQMNPEEAVGILRACVVSILGNPHIAPPIQFAELRRALEVESLPPEDERVTQIAESPYFVQRTTLSVLLSLLKTAHGAQLEHAVGNTNVVLPRIWPNLRKTERWQVGQTFAEVHSAGKHSAAVGLKHALTVVRGFDFVPETLRSETFSKAAHEVMEAHFGMNNFYKERAPMAQLASLGTTIPRPAFPVCMTAVLCVRLGNYFGHAWNAQEYVEQVLGALRKEQWEYYLNECLATDNTILDKLGSASPANRWVEMSRQYQLREKEIASHDTLTLVSAATAGAVHMALGKLRQRR